MGIRRKFIPVIAAVMIILSAFPVSAAGWTQDNFGWWYVNEDGSYPTSEWREIDGRWYYFKDSGYMVTGPAQIGDKQYYFYDSGAMASVTWIELHKDWYYFNEDGSLATSAWIGDIYYVNQFGAMVRDKTIDGRYIDEHGEGEAPDNIFDDE